MKKEQPLVSLGLHSEEIGIYETLLTHGALSPTELCALTKLHRPTLYKRLKELDSKNLITLTPHGKRKKYIANSPKKLKELSFLKDKIVQDEIIRLEELVSTPRNIPHITVHQGASALRLIDEQMTQELKKNDTYYRYSSIDNETWIPGRYMTKRAKSLRDAKALQRLVITNEETRSRQRNNKNRSIKIVPKKYDLFKHGVGQVIYDDKIIIIDYNNEIAVVIDNAPVAAFQKALFKTLFHYL